MSTLPSGLSRSLFTEKMVAQELLGDFCAEGSRGKQFVMDFFDNNVTINRAIDLGNILSKMLGIDFPRNYKRNKNLVYKWFDINMDQIETVSNCITVEYEN